MDLPAERHCLGYARDATKLATCEVTRQKNVQQAGRRSPEEEPGREL